MHAEGKDPVAELPANRIGSNSQPLARIAEFLGLRRGRRALGEWLNQNGSWNWPARRKTLILLGPGQYWLHLFRNEEYIVRGIVFALLLPRMRGITTG